MKKPKDNDGVVTKEISEKDTVKTKVLEFIKENKVPEFDEHGIPYLQ